MIPRDRASDAQTIAGVSVDDTIEKDLLAARSIARQVAGGVEAVAEGVESATSSPLRALVEAPTKLSLITEKVRQDFFHKEVPFGEVIYKEAKKNDLRPELVAAVVQADLLPAGRPLRVRRHRSHAARPATMARGAPTAMPATTIPSDCLSTSPTTAAPRAPSAIRIPNSAVRSVT